MVWLRGKEVIAARRPSLIQRIEDFQRLAGRPPGLAVVLVGEDPASQVYVRGKLKACEKAGIFHKEVRLSAEAKESEVLKELEKLNRNPQVDAYLVQLPLPQHLDAQKIIAHIDPLKDADGLTPLNLGGLITGRGAVTPCTPQGIVSMLEHYKIALEGKRAVVVGRSQIVGLSMAHLLLRKNATVTVTHSKTESLEEHTRSADLVIVAAGRPRLLGKSDFKKGAVVVDVGIHREEGEKVQLFGDVRTEELDGHVFAATPVPGGVGPMTIHTLLENAVRLAELNQERNHV